MIRLKRFMLETGSCALMAVLASLLLVREAHAYLDPGTGSYIIQILLASLLGALFMLKVYWGRIVGFFSKGSSALGPLGGNKLPDTLDSENVLKGQTGFQDA